MPTMPTMPTPPRASARSSWKVRRPLPPIEGESLDGFIARVAAHNMLDNALAITSQGGVAYAHRPDLTTHGWDGLETVAECLRIDVAELRRRAYPQAEVRDDARFFFGVPIERRHLETRSRRFSPAALQQSPHHRALWQLRPFPFCIESWEYLIDRCPRCLAIQRWYRTNGVDRCDYCVEDLTRASAAMVPLEERPAAEAAAHLVHPDEERRLAVLATLPAQIRPIGCSGALDLLIRLLALVEGEMPGTAASTRRGWRANPATITSALATAWPLLLGWPDAPLAYMSRKIEPATTRCNDGNSGRSLRFLARRASRAPLVDEIIASLRQRVDLNGPEGTDIVKRTLHIRQAGQTLGLSTRKIANIRRAGGLPAVFCVKGGQALARYDAAETTELRQLVDRRVAFERAAWVLGISYHGVEQLAVLGLLPEIAHPFFRIRYGGPQTTSDRLADLSSALENGARLAVSEPLIPLRHAVHAIGGRLKPWGPIFQALLKGDVLYALSDRERRLSQRILVERSSIPLLTRLEFYRRDFPDTLFAASMTRHDAGEALNLQPKDYTPFLRTYEAGSPGTDQIVPVGEILRFARGLISTSELAMRLGINPGVASRQLKKLQLGAVAGSLWDRSSVERLLLS